MVRLDVKDKDPFAHADDEPKDNISTGGFIFRAIFRYLKIFKKLNCSKSKIDKKKIIFFHTLL